MTEPRGFDKVTGTFFAVFLLFMMGILAFAFSVGPTGVAMTCRRPEASCEVVERYFFGLGRTRRVVFAEAAIAGARVQPPIPSAFGHHGQPRTVELVLKDGTVYPTVDYYFKAWAQRKAEAFDAYLRDASAKGFALELSAGEEFLILAVMLAPYWLGALALAGVAFKSRSSGKSP